MNRCNGCIHAKMYACTQGREFYPNGTAELCKPTRKKRGFELHLAQDLWFEYVNGGLCGLCGNTGYVDTTLSAISKAGVRCGVRLPCICPNGRLEKENQSPIEQLLEGAITITDAIQYSFAVEVVATVTLGTLTFSLNATGDDEREARKNVCTLALKRIKEHLAEILRNVAYATLEMMLD